MARRIKKDRPAFVATPALSKLAEPALTAAAPIHGSMDYASNDLVSPQETADHLGLKVGTLAIWRCLKKTELPWVKVGRKIKYRPCDVQSYILNHRIASPTSPPSSVLPPVSPSQPQSAPRSSVRALNRASSH